jgi:acyl-coenzyme A thioesterase PaaI-like protein
VRPDHPSATLPARGLEPLLEKSMPDPDSRALESAVTSLRRVIGHLRKTKAPLELLQDAQREFDALSARFEPFDHPGPYAQGALDIGEGSVAPNIHDPGAFFPYSPVIGSRNPIAPNIAFEVRDGELHAEHVFDAPWCGPPTAVHGGVIALVFDELLGCTNVVNAVGGFTGTLEVKYLALTLLHEPIRLRGWIDRRDGRKTYTKGTMHRAEILCAQAEGVFISPSERSIEQMGLVRPSS